MEEADQPHVFTFARDIDRVFTKRGCNDSSCHGGVKGRSTACLVFGAGVDRGQVEGGDDLDEEEDQIAFGQFGQRTVVLVTIEVRMPRTVGFARDSVHDRSLKVVGIVRG